MKDDRRFIRIFQEDLLEDIEHDREDDECSKTCGHNDTRAMLRDLLRYRRRDEFEYTHILRTRRQALEVEKERETTM